MLLPVFCFGNLNVGFKPGAVCPLSDNQIRVVASQLFCFFFILVVRFDDAFRVSYIRFAACSYVYARVFIKCVLCVGMFEFGFFIFSFLSVIRQLLHLLRTKLW